MILVAALAIAGCSRTPPPPAKTGNSLKGTISLDGELVTIGTLRVIHEETGASLETKIGRKGKYFLENLPAGKLKITVIPPPGSETPPPDENPVPPKSPAKGPPGHAERLKSIQKLPIRYSDPDQSGLEFVVAAGDNTYEIKLLTD